MKSQTLEEIETTATDFSVVQMEAKHRKGICGYGQLEKATELAARVRRANGKAEKQSLSDRQAELPELLFETMAGLHLEHHIQLRLAFVQKRKSELKTEGISQNKLREQSLKK